MKFTLLSYLGTLAIAGFLNSSCSKPNINSENTKNSTEASLFQTEFPERIAPTRKAKQLLITDPETGQQQVYYDCREAGATCDVGENPPPPPPSGGSRMTNHYKMRVATIEVTKNKGSDEIRAVLAHNETRLKEVFPVLYSERVKSGLNNGTLRLISRDSYIAVVEKSNSSLPLIVYLTKSSSNQSRIAPIDTAKTKVAKVNTETGIIECKEPGRNCSVSLANNFDIPHSEYIPMLEREFNNNKLGEAILNGSYKIYETAKYIKLEPTSGRGEPLFLLK